MARNASIALVLAAVLAGPLLILLVAHRIAGDGAGLQPGQELPAGQLLSFDSLVVDTRSWKGTPTLLVLFRSTCKACQREIEGLATVAPALPEMRIVLLAFDLAAPRVQSGFPVFSDPSGQFVRKVGKLIVPTLYLMDASGRVAYVRSGQRPPENELATLLALVRSE